MSNLLALTSQFDVDKWRALGVVACEHRVTTSMLDRLELAMDVRSWFNDCAARGLVVDAGVVYGPAYTPRISGERAVVIAPDYRTLVLRQLANTGALARLRDDAKRTTGHASLAGFMTALYAGDLGALRVELAEVLRRSARGEEESIVRCRLREAVCTPFDPEALTQCWSDNGWPLVEQVLLDAVVTLEPVDELYRWALSRLGAGCGPRCLRILAEHALLRGDLSTMAQLRSYLPTIDLPGFCVAESFLRGDLEQAQRLLDELAASKQKSKRPLPCPTSITALLAVLALSRPQPAGTTLAKRFMQRYSAPEASPLLGWPVVNSQLALVRALRVLIRTLTQPEADRARLSPYHLATDTPAWQTLMTAITVLVEDSDVTTRMAWTRRLIDDAARWEQGGYVWFVRQARQLAKSLSVDSTQELESLAPCQSNELSLSLLLEREPEWRIAIRTVDKLLQSAEREHATLARRVAWYLDMSTGELAKPGLEEYRNGSGWTPPRRVDLDALRAIKDTLPPEDDAVLMAIDAAPHHGRFPLEGVEALCGHRRVFNGARGRQSVEVVRGTCRIKTSRDRGHLVVQLEPAGAAEGIHVVVESETRVVVYRIDAVLARLTQAMSNGIRIPENHQNEGRALLARLAEQVEIDSPELGACRVAVADATPVLRISCEAGAWWVEIGVRPFGEFGRFFPAGIGRSVVTLHGEGELLDTERNPDLEIAGYHALLAACPTLLNAARGELQDVDVESEHAHSFSLGEEELYSLLSELRESGQRCAVEWKNSRPIASKGSVTRASLHGSLRRIKGWYLVNGSISLDDVSQIDLSSLVRMPFTKSGRFVRLPSGDFLEVERRIRQVILGLACAAQLPPRGCVGELRVPEEAFDTLHSLLDNAGTLNVDASVTDWSARLDATLACEPLLPSELRANLRPYQLEGYRWLYRYNRLGFGVCLADDMGLGKTLQVIALLLAQAAQGPTLVVAPTSVCSNWIDELRRFAPSLEVAEYSGRGRGKLIERLRVADAGKPLNVLVTSYALLQQDAAELASVEWNIAVIDEAQFIKNPSSLRAKAAFQLTARHRVAMTGTPVENHLGDLWSIFHFLNPALLGSLRHFHLAYVRPIERDHDLEQRDLLKRLVQPFLLRRRKDEVLKELPPTTTVRHEVRLSEDEARRYAL
ncbi:MAG TPA: SNF2-related protein, partial [Polyangiaceae bacterium]|nr:SNF2-related protein [Polyangiaceae bacterium]